MKVESKERVKKTEKRKSGKGDLRGEFYCHLIAVGRILIIVPAESI